MRIFYFLFFFNTIFIFCQEDTNLPGVVVEQNSKFNTGRIVYLSKAQIRSPGAAPQMSDSKGRFTLIYSNKPNGNLAIIYASKNGYQVVNEVELKKSAIIGRKTPMKVVLCERGKYLENQLSYYDISRDAVVKSYETRINRLEKEGDERKKLITELKLQLNKEINSVHEAREILEKQLINSELKAKKLAERFLTVNLDDQSPAYQNAFKFFLQGDIEGALNILDKVDLKGRLEINAQEAGKDKEILTEIGERLLIREKQIKQDTEQCLFKARLHVLEYEFLSAEMYYDLAFKYGVDDESFIGEYLSFLMTQNKLDKAKKYALEEIKSLRKLVEEDSYYKQDLANILANVAEVFSNLQQRKEAIKYYGEAKKIYEELVFEDPEWYFPSYGAILHNMGEFYSTIDEIMAEDFYIKSIEINEVLRDEKVSFELAILSGSLSSLANIYRRREKYLDAKRWGREAVKISRMVIAKEESDFNNLLLAKNLDVLGSLYFELDSVNASEKSYTEALEILEKLNKKNPKAYALNLAQVCNNLGIYYGKTGNLNKAIIKMDRALEALKILLEDTSSVFKIEYADLLRNYGHILGINKKEIEATEYFLKAVQMADDLVLEYPNSYFDNYINIHIYYGDFLLNSENYEKALVIFPKILSYLDFNETVNLQKRLSEKSRILLRLGIVYVKSQKYDLAKSSFFKSIEIAQELFKKNPKSHAMALLRALNHIGIFHAEQKLEFPEGYLSNVNKLEGLFEFITLSELIDLSKILSYHGKVLFVENKYSSSVNFLRMSLKVKRFLSIVDPDSYQHEYALGLSDLAYIYWKVDATEASEKMYLESLEIFQRYTEENNFQFVSTILDNLNELGMLNYDKGEVNKAEKYLIEGRNIISKIGTDYGPGNYDRFYCMLSANLLEIYGKEIEKNGEKIYTKRAAEILNQIKSHGMIANEADSELKECLEHLKSIQEVYGF
ncbi:tetratricopeptide repeat protein [Ulvibacterium marinum]|uniref:Tetratricopeptide repeat protein n=1 Tax=Ulvibacterium marinum TaxID=2419782 RepID=A0A3B0C500_9FLAO|nr:tetratricopeptide repeat protein [Ulvibacterium marinum]RKN79791.1 tetratricopeptide repeat protein [Ulvibacterium marinum]